MSDIQAWKSIPRICGGGGLITVHLMRGENEPLDLIEGSVQEIVRPVIESPSVQLSLMDIPTHVNLR